MTGLALAAVLWPGAHLVWVARMDVDPWEFFGWAMYARPAARVQVRIEVERGPADVGAGEGAEPAASEPLRAMGALRRELERYARRRSTLGRHADDGPLRAGVFAHDGSISALTIVERNVRLDLDSAKLVGDLERRRYVRSEAGPTVGTEGP